MSGLLRTVHIMLIIAVIALLLPAASVAQQVTTREYPYLYKSPRTMGMGGVNIAIGGRVDTLFYNPAGLINIPQDKGWEVDLINVTAEYDDNVKSFMNDMDNANNVGDLNGNGQTDDDRLQATNDVLAKYQGKPLHVRAADFTAFGKNYDRWAFGMGGLVNARLDARTHQGFGADGLLEVNADGYYGGIGGAAFKLSDNVSAGLSAKYLHREALIHVFTATELLQHENDLDNYITNALRVAGNGVGLDAGLMWKFAQDSSLKPAFGASLMNIGNLSFDKAGQIPMTLNAGFSINPSISWSRALTVAVDYVDILNNYEQDKDTAKRLRIGAELQVFDIAPVELALRAGLYNNSPTFGADLRLLFITFTYAMYTEETGAYAGQDKDKRQLFNVNIGW